MDKSAEEKVVNILIKWLGDISGSDLLLVGSKGFNLGLLTRGGFPVPEGFCVTTSAYGESQDGRLSARAVEACLEAYHQIGGGKVAVRSSAIAEDLPNASFAGQQDTYLNVCGDSELISAIERCWASLWSQRAESYRQHIAVDDSNVSMAVVVQRMIEPDSSGVMFSVNPSNPDQIVIESSWGLGEAIVSGKVTPDRFTVCRNSLQIIDRNISLKEAMITQNGKVSVPNEKQNMPSLKDDQVVQLAKMGLDIERFFSSPQDIEWAIADGRIYILQSRPITVLGADGELERLRQEEVEKLARIAEDAGTVWCSFNLSETLPAPLPMTWAIISKFMSGRGGFGLAYRELGFIPAREVDERGVVDLICGRVYFNLSREVRLYFSEFPFEHNFDKLKSNPACASYPQPTVNIRRATAMFWLKFPYYAYKMISADRKMKHIRKDYDVKLRTQIIPEFCKYIEEQKKIELDNLSDSAIISKMNEWIDRTLRDFTKDGLKAGILAGLSYSNLKNSLIKCFGEEDANAVLNDLIVGLEGDIAVEMNRHLWEVSQGQISKEDFLKLYGHRAVGEFELAQPRWREDNGYIENMVEMFRKHKELNPLLQEQTQKERRKKAEDDLHKRLSSGKGRAYRKAILREMEYVQRYLPFRETAKFYLMMGYELIRKALLELNRRYFGGADDIFYLTPDELPQLIAGERFDTKIKERRAKHDNLLKIELPDVIFSDSLDQIGNPPPPAGSHELSGVPVSRGVATGKAKVLLKPPERLDSIDTGYILVCPSTDPGWAPLFPSVKGIVMERGGVLSHGAIVAREYGIPCVVNIPGATRILKDGLEITVDGNKGKVFVRENTD